MMGQWEYRFQTSDFSVGLHFDVYPPGIDPEIHQAMDFWITVKKS